MYKSHLYKLKTLSLKVKLVSVFLLLNGSILFAQPSSAGHDMVYLGYGFAFVEENDSIIFKLLDQDLYDSDILDTTFQIREALDFINVGDSIAYYSNGAHIYDHDHNQLDTSANGVGYISSQCNLFPDSASGKFKFFSVGPDGCESKLQFLRLDPNNGHSIVSQNEFIRKTGEQTAIALLHSYSTVRYLAHLVESDTFVLTEFTNSSYTRRYFPSNYFMRNSGDGIGKLRFNSDATKFVMTTFTGYLISGILSNPSMPSSLPLHDSIWQLSLRPYGLEIVNDTAYISAIKDTSVDLLIYSLSNGFTRIDSINVSSLMSYDLGVANMTKLGNKIIIYTNQNYTYFTPGVNHNQMAHDLVNNTQGKDTILFKSVALPNKPIYIKDKFEFSIIESSDKVFTCIPNSGIGGYSGYEWEFLDPTQRLKSHEKIPVFKSAEKKLQVRFIGFNNISLKLDTLYKYLEKPLKLETYRCDTVICFGDHLEISYNFIKSHFDVENINEYIEISKEGEYIIKDLDLAKNYIINVDTKICDKYIANAFTPNNDGINDIFTPISSKLKHLVEPINSYKLSIYDRNKRLVFESSDIDVGWDGTDVSKPVANDVFIYIIDISYKDKSQRIIGELTLVR